MRPARFVMFVDTKTARSKTSLSESGLIQIVMLRMTETITQLRTYEK